MLLSALMNIVCLCFGSSRTVHWDAVCHCCQHCWLGVRESVHLCCQANNTPQCDCLSCLHRTRAKGEINGKSANLNNALKNIIYQEHVGNPGQIPLGELVVVFDADMQVRTQW